MSEPTDQMTIITANQAAELLKIHRTTLYEQARAGTIPCRRIGRRFIFVREILVAWACGTDEPKV